MSCSHTFAFIGGVRQTRRRPYRPKQAHGMLLLSNRLPSFLMTMCLPRSLDLGRQPASLMLDTDTDMDMGMGMDSKTSCRCRHSSHHRNRRNLLHRSLNKLPPACRLLPESLLMTTTSNRPSSSAISTRGSQGRSREYLTMKSRVSLAA